MVKVLGKDYEVSVHTSNNPRTETKSLNQD